MNPYYDNYDQTEKPTSNPYYDDFDWEDHVSAYKKKPGIASRVASTTAKVGRQAYQSVGEGAGDAMLGIATQIEHAPILPPPHMTLGQTRDWGKYHPETVEAVKRGDTIGKNELSDMLRTASEAYPGVEEGRPLGVISDMINGMLRFAPSIPLTKANPVAGLMLIYEQLAGDKYKQYIEEGKDEDTAFKASQINAMINAPIELAGNVLQIGKIVKILDTKGVSKALGPKAKMYLKTIFENALTEGAEELLQEQGDLITDEYANNPDANPVELANAVTEKFLTIEHAKRSGQAFGVGFGGSVLMTGAGVMGRIGQDVVNKKGWIGKESDDIIAIRNRITQKGIELGRAPTQEEVDQIVRDYRDSSELEKAELIDAVNETIAKQEASEPIDVLEVARGIPTREQQIARDLEVRGTVPGFQPISGESAQESARVFEETLPYSEGIEQQYKRSQRGSELLKRDLALQDPYLQDIAFRIITGEQLDLTGLNEQDLRSIEYIIEQAAQSLPGGGTVPVREGMGLVTERPVATEITGLLPEEQRKLPAPEPGLLPAPPTDMGPEGQFGPPRRSPIRQESSAPILMGELSKGDDPKNYTGKELRQIAKERGLEIPKDMVKKSDMIEFIKAGEPAPVKEVSEAKVSTNPDEAFNFRDWVNRTGGLNVNDKTHKGTFADMRWDVNSSGRKVPASGFPRGLWRFSGIGMDERTLQAIEAGWLPEGSTEDDFIEMLESNPGYKDKYSRAAAGIIDVDIEAEGEYYRLQAEEEEYYRQQQEDIKNGEYTEDEARADEREVQEDFRAQIPEDQEFPVTDEDLERIFGSTEIEVPEKPIKVQRSSEEAGDNTLYQIIEGENEGSTLLRPTITQSPGKYDVDETLMPIVAEKAKMGDSDLLLKDLERLRKKPAKKTEDDINTVDGKTPQQHIQDIINNTEATEKEVLAEKKDIKEQLIAGVKTGEFDGAVRFGTMGEVKAILKQGQMPISTEHGVIHAQPIMGKDDDVFVAYGNRYRHNVAIVFPKGAMIKKLDAHTKEVLIDDKVDVNDLKFLIAGHKKAYTFSELKSMTEAKQPVETKTETPAKEAEDTKETAPEEKFRPWIDVDSEPKILFHSSNSSESFTIQDTNIEWTGTGNDIEFGGVFAGPKGGMDHDYNHAILLDPKKIAGTYDIKYTHDTNKYLTERFKDLRENDIEKLESLIYEDSLLVDNEEWLSDLKSVFKTKDLGDADYKVQKLRGEVARHFGYQAIEMSDETGTSYLVLPGIKTEVLHENEPIRKAEQRIYSEWKQWQETKQAPKKAGNIESEFIETVKKQFGFTDTEARAILSEYKKGNVVEIDPASGQFILSSDQYWNKEAMQAILDSVSIPTQSPEEISRQVSEFFKGDKKQTPGQVYLDKGGVKYFNTSREIKRGVKKGKIEVTLTNGSKVIVRPEQIRRMPGEEIFTEGANRVEESGAQYAYVSTEGEPSLEFKSEQKPTVSQRVKMSTTGYIKAAGNVVTGAGDVASLLASIRKSPQEILYTVTVDKDGVILEVHKYTKGVKASAHVSATEAAGRILNVEGARTAYIVHNHPSGNTEPSQPDRLVIESISSLLKSGDVITKGLIIGNNSFRDLEVSNARPIKPALRKVLVPVKERTTLIKGKAIGKVVANSYDVIELFNSGKFGDDSGALLLDNENNKPVAFVPFIKGQSMKQTTADIVRLAEHTNSNAIILRNNSKSENIKKYIDTLHEGGIGDMRILDTIENGKSRGWPPTIGDAKPDYYTLLSDRSVFLKEADLKADQAYTERLTSAKKTGITLKGAQSVVGKVKAAFPNIGEIEVLPKQADIPEEVIKRGGIKSTDKVFAYYDPVQDKIYVIHENMNSPDTVIDAILHEGIGHRGVDSILTKENRRELFRMVERDYKDTDIGKKIIKDYRIDFNNPQDRVTFSREVIAHMTNQPKATLLDRIVAFIRDIIRKFRPSLKVTDSEIKSLLRRSAEFAREGRGTFSRGEPVYSVRKTADIFYSALEQGVDNLKQEVATPEQWQGMINKLPVRAEELEWIGLPDWLKEQEGKVTKQAILDYVRANNVQIEEVTKGDEAGHNVIWEKYKDGSLHTIDKFDDSWTIREDPYHEGQYEILWAGSNYENKIFDTIEEAKDYANKAIDRSPADPTQYSEWQMPGGRNYREMLLAIPVERVDITAPDGHIVKGAIKPYSTYTSSHWDEPNVLAHVRFNERKMPNGEKVLFLEEIQSDWAQEGRRKGFEGDKEPTIKQFGISFEGGPPNLFFNTRQEAQDRIDQIKEDISEPLTIQEVMRPDRSATGGMIPTRTPNMPFKKSWPMLVIKRMVRYAAENGFDSIAWTPGEVQAERYDLSKHISRIFYSTYDNGETFHINAKSIADDSAVLEGNYKADELENILGKEVAQKIINGEGKNDPDLSGVKYLSGLDLKVGGEGMKGFYDKILPSEVNKFFNKPAWGKAKVGTIDISTRGTPEQRLENVFSRRYNKDISREKTAKVWHLPITPEMKEKALYEGMPAFQRETTIDDLTKDLHGEITKESKLAKRTEAEALVDGMIDEGWDNLVSYKTKPEWMKAQSEKAVKFLNENWEKAKKIALGEETSPEGIEEGFIWKAVKLRAFTEGNDDLVYQLATESGIPELGSKLGQRIKAFDESSNIEDPEVAIREVGKFRKDKNKRQGKKVVSVKKIKELKEKLDEAEAKLKEYEGKTEDENIDATIDKLIEKSPKRLYKKTNSKILKEQIKNSLDQGLSETSADIQALAKYFITQGVTERNALVKEVHNVIKDVIPGITIRETMDAISGYGKFKPLSKDEILVKLRDLKGQMQQVAKLQDMQKGKAPLKTGIERRIPSDEERRLIKQVEEMKKELGIETIDPERQLKSSLDAVKTRLANEIKDLEYQIATKQKIVKTRTNLKYDAEANRLQKRRDDLKKQFHEIFGSEITDQQRINAAIKATEKAIVEYTRMINENDLTPKAKRTPVQSEELNKARKERDRLKAQIKELRDLAKPKRTPEEIATQRLETRLKNEIKKLTTKLENLDLKKDQRQETVLSAEGRKLKAQRDDLKTALNAATKASGIVTREEASRLIELSRILANAREEAGTDGYNSKYGAAKVAFLEYIDFLKGTDKTIKEMLTGEWEEVRTIWKDNKAKAFTKSIMDIIRTVSDLSISLLATLDNSFLGRQGFNAFLTNNSIWLRNSAKSFIDIYKTMESKHGGEMVKSAVMADAYSRPNYRNGDYDTAKLIPKTEEQFPTSIPERVPFAGRLFKASENAFTNSGIRMRIDTYDLLKKIAIEQGVDVKDKLWIQETGKLINSITARGDLGRLGSGGPLRLIFWAPKMLWGNVNVLTAHFGGAGLKHPFARQQARKNLLKIVGYTVLIAAIADAIGRLFGKDDVVEWNPISSDFMKIKVNNTRHDITAGKGSIITSLARALTFRTKSTKTKRITKLNSGEFGSRSLFDVIIDFMANKSAPLTKTAIDIARGRNFDYEKPGIGNVAYNLATPIGVQNFVETYQRADELKDIPVEEIIADLLDLVGINTDTYDSDVEMRRKYRALRRE